jgi:hypothetical protein
MPPQLDGIAMLFGIVSHRLGAVVAGVFALLIGAVGVVAAVLPPRKDGAA